jgi:hypothetical protein
MKLPLFSSDLELLYDFAEYAFAKLSLVRFETVGRK